jgi:hypothetical protein
MDYKEIVVMEVNCLHINLGTSLAASILQCCQLRNPFLEVVVWEVRGGISKPVTVTPEVIFVM